MPSPPRPGLATPAHCSSSAGAVPWFIRARGSRHADQSRLARVIMRLEPASMRLGVCTLFLPAWLAPIFSSKKENQLRTI